jgi:hypothetical protein
MRIAWLLLGLTGAIGAVLLVAIVGGEAVPPLRPHPEHPSLLQATDGARRVAPVFALGALFGFLQIAFFGVCFALGMRRRGSLGPVARPLALALLGYAAVFAALLVSYRRFLMDETPALVLGFPAPTAWMLFGLWPVPLLFVWIYLRHFDGWVVDEAEIERVLALGRDDADRPRGDRDRT